MATVDIRDQVSGALRELQAQLSPEQINPAIGRAEVGLFQRWFASKPQNKQNWPSTGFWADCARATNFSLLPEGPMISVNKLGARQRYAGGEIKPTEGKYLTIPERAEAYGKRAREFDNLKLAFRRDSGGVHAWALVEAPRTLIDLKKKRQKGATVSDFATVASELVMFWLVKSVRQDADPTTIPPDNLIGAVAIETIGDAAERAFRRTGP